MEVIEAPASVEQPFKQPICSHLFTSECDVPVPGIFHFFGGMGKIWYRKKVSEPVSEKFGTGKKYRYRYRKYLVSKIRDFFPVPVASFFPLFFYPFPKNKFSQPSL